MQFAAEEAYTSSQLKSGFGDPLDNVLGLLDRSLPTYRNLWSDISTGRDAYVQL
jgi:hypothetical protein